MSTLCRCKPHDNQRPGLSKPCRRGRRMTKGLGAALSTLALMLMPKCPVCLAAYVTFLTGLSLSAAVARHLHTGLLIACGGVLLWVMIRPGYALWHWLKRVLPRAMSR